MNDCLKETFIYDEMTGNIYRNGNIATTPHSKGYLQISFHSRKYLAHRLAWYLHFGRWPLSQLDHINRVKTDNRITNLREVTGSQNLFNRAEQSNNKSGKSGVFWYERKKRWIAYIKKSGQRINLGSFKQFDEALVARIKAESQLYPKIVF